MIDTIVLELQIMAKIKEENERVAAAELIIDQLLYMLDLNKRSLERTG